jgi:hypothetical protein
MKYLIGSILLLLPFSLFSQIYGTTDEGRRIQLNEDGTWKYLEQDTSLRVIPTNPTPFLKSSSAIAQIKSAENSIVINYNPVKWKVSRNKNNDDSEFEFSHVKGNAYAMVITEKVEIPLESLLNIAFETLVANAPDSKIDKSEFRTVNGVKMLHAEMSGTLQGIKFVYYSYYYSDEAGTSQIVCYTAKNLLKDYRSDFDEFLNGLTATPVK